jgi:5'-methylthioadenosine phosphorylase
MTTTATLAVIGGSGMYSIPGLTDTRELNLDTPFGKPSAPIVVGTLEKLKVAFLARHGLGHHISVKIPGSGTHNQYQRLRFSA